MVFVVSLTLIFHTACVLYFILFYFVIRYFLHLHFKCYPFSQFPLRKPPISSPFPCSSTHPLPLPGPTIPLHWGIHQVFTGTWLLLPLMTHQAILCYICSQSHESHHVFSVVAGLVPGSSGVLVSSYCCSSYGAANPFNSLGPFSSSFIGDPVLSPMIGCEH